MQRWFELHSADSRVVGSLGFEKAFGTSARADCADVAWTFKRVGFLNARVTIRRLGSQADVAVYHPKVFGGGLLQTSEGRISYWRQMNFWATEWSFTDTNGVPLVIFKPGAESQSLSNLFKSQSSVELALDEKDPTELALLVLLGWYLMVMSQEDAASAGAVAATM